MIDLNARAFFAAVAQQGSFTKAAATLGTPISTVSRKVAELERELGARLLERSTRRLRLTEIGAEYLAQCQRGLDALEAADQLIKERRRDITGLLRISYAPNLSECLFAPLINTFQQQHPKIRIRALVTERKVDLIADGVDLAFRVGPIDDSRLAARRLATFRHRLMAAPRYLAESGMPQTPKDLAGHRLLVFGGSGKPRHWQLESARQTTTLAVEPCLEVNDFAALLAAAKDGLGIADLSPLVLGDALNDQGLVPVMPNWQRPQVDFSALHLGTRNMSRLPRAFLDHCIERLPDELT